MPSLRKTLFKYARQLGVPFKALSDEEKAKKAAEAERKKKGELLNTALAWIDQAVRHLCTPRVHLNLQDVVQPVRPPPGCTS